MADCNGCKAPDKIPYIVFESEMARAERLAKRLWAVIILLIVLLVGSNCAWLYYESTFEETSTTQEVKQITDGDGDNTFIGGDIYGRSGS